MSFGPTPIADDLERHVAELDHEDRLYLGPLVGRVRTLEVCYAGAKQRRADVLDRLDEVEAELDTAYLTIKTLTDELASWKATVEVWESLPDAGKLLRKAGLR